MRTNLTEKQPHLKATVRSSVKLESMTWMLLIMVTVILSGCGNKGDLYVPEKEDTKQQEMSQSNG